MVSPKQLEELAVTAQGSGDPSERAGAIQGLRLAVDALEMEVLADLRESGATWVAIAAGYGLTPEAIAARAARRGVR